MLFVIIEIEAQKGTLLTKTKEKVEKNAGDNGVTEFGEKVGGIGQPPMRVVENAIIGFSVEFIFLKHIVNAWQCSL
jgi:hypothetical protein